MKVSQLKGLTKVEQLKFYARTRPEVTKQIKQSLKERTGLTWSVTGNRGTAWGWLTIAAPKARRVMHDENPNCDFMVNGSGGPVGSEQEHPWIERPPRDDETAYYTSQVDREILAETLGIGMNQASSQGVSISPDNWDFYLDRAANGQPPVVIEEPQEIIFVEYPEAPEIDDSQMENVEIGNYQLYRDSVPAGE